jgi:hypothetical protein
VGERREDVYINQISIFDYAKLTSQHSRQIKVRRISNASDIDADILLIAVVYLSHLSLLEVIFESSSRIILVTFELLSQHLDALFVSKISEYFALLVVFAAFLS